MSEAALFVPFLVGFGLGAGFALFLTLGLLWALNQKTRDDNEE
jgi:hypothetical protein